MDAFVFFPDNEEQLKKLEAIATELNISATKLNEDEKKRLGGMLLANLSKKNPKAYATMEEIISVVEEVRAENYYGKKDNNS